MSAAVTTDALQRCIDRGLGFLVGAQGADGELPSFASPLEDAEAIWVPDTLKFITALGALALHELPDDRARSVVDRAVGFLRRERESGAQWRYWAQRNDQYDFTPPDADDTACASLAVATRGDRTRANAALLLANRDPQGRFYTWLVPRSFPADPRRTWAMRDELRSTVRHRRDELWRSTEAERDDVDGVVNANVIRYLGPRRAPAAAVRWVRSIIEDGHEDDCDSWHRNRHTLYAVLADGHRRGIAEFAPLGPTIAARIAERAAPVDGGASLGAPLDDALALLALQGFDLDPALRCALAGGLAERQLDDGSWERSVFYYGGPREVFGWASEALATAWALQALHHQMRVDGGTRS